MFLQFSTQNYRLNDNKLTDIYFQYSGIAETLPNHSFGPAIRSDYLIHIILNGEGNYYVGKKIYTIRKNQGFLIKPNESTFYRSDSENPWTYCWMAFNGKMAKYILKTAGLMDPEKRVFEINDAEKFFEIVIESLSYYDQSFLHELKLNSLVLNFLYLILNRNKNENLFGRERLMNQITLDLIDYFEKNYTQDIKIGKISELLGFNCSHVSRIFNHDMGITAKEYLNHIRLTAATELLTATNLSMTEICYQCGFNHYDVFNRAFKKKFGKSPLQYRKDFKFSYSNAKSSRKIDLFIKDLPLNQ